MISIVKSGITQTTQRTVLWIITLAIALRLLFIPFALHESRYLRPDSHQYHQLALNLLQHSVFSPSAGPPFQPETFRTPGYPAFLAAIYVLVGDNPLIVLLIQAVLGAGTVWLTYRLGKSLWGATAGLWAAGFLAVDPVSVLYSSYLLSETLFTAIVLVAFAFLVLWLKHRNGGGADLEEQTSEVSTAPSLIRRHRSEQSQDQEKAMEQTSEVSRAVAQVSYAPLVHLGGAGLGIGIATLVRPITFYLPLALGLLVAWRLWGSKRQMVTALLILFLSYLVIVGPWLVRNYQQAGIRQISTVQSSNLFYYRAAGVLATETGTDLQSARQQLQQAVDAELANSHSAPGQRPAVEVRVAVRTMLAHPGALLHMSLTSVARVVIGPGKAALFDLTGTPPTPLRIALLGLETLLLMGLYLAALYGAFQLVNVRQYWILALIALVIGYFLLISSGPEAYSRFRVPIVPYITLLAGCGAGHVLASDRLPNRLPRDLGDLVRREA